MKEKIKKFLNDHPYEVYSTIIVVGIILLIVL